MNLNKYALKFDVRVYRNLTKKCWSVQHRVKGKGWRLYAHMDSVLLSGCQFIVNKAGQDRVRKEGKKYVHAYVQGAIMLDTNKFCLFDNKPQITYNPYKNDTFMQLGHRVSYRDMVYFDNSGKVFSGLL